MTFIFTTAPCAEKCPRWMDLRIYSQKLAPAFMALRIELLDGVDWEIADRRSQS